MPVKTVSFVALVCATLALPLLASDWVQWRGPSRSGVSAEKGLADQWRPGGPHLIWQAKDVGDGYGSAAVAGERVFVLGNEGLENEFVQALNAATGLRIWRTRIGNVGEPDQSPEYPAARSTPTLDGNMLYAFGSDGDLACLETSSGRIRWQKNVRQEFGGNPGTWAYCESPLVDGNVVVCSPGGPDAPMAAFDKNTGSVIWKAQISEGDDAGYASAIVLNAGGKKQYVQFLAKGLVGVDAANGKLLWRYDGTGSGPANMATPVARDNLIYTPGQAGSAVVELTSANGGIQADELYRVRGMPNAIGGTVLIDGHLYGTERNDGLICADFMTGEVKWKDPSIGMGALCSADGLLFVYGEDGEVALVEATPKAYREKGRFTPPDRPEHSNQMEKSWAYPVVANGRLYVRDKNAIWCYDVSDRATAGK